MLSFLQFIKSNYAHSVLVEGITELHNTIYQKLPISTIKRLVALDPTYEAGNNELGVYGKWILEKYYAAYKDQERHDKWKNSDDHLKYDAPARKSVDTMESFNDHLTELLQKFDIMRLTKKANIVTIKSIKELGAAVKDIARGDTATINSLKLMYKSISKGAKKFYESDKWLVIKSQSHADNIVFENATNWCTTQRSGDAYNNYIKEYGGSYYVCMSKKDGSLYQLHFESEQTKNSADEDIDVNKVFSNDSKLMSIWDKAVEHARQAEFEKLLKYAKNKFIVVKEDDRYAYVLMKTNKSNIWVFDKQEFARNFVKIEKTPKEIQDLIHKEINNN